jgi:hypothetical protein
VRLENVVLSSCIGQTSLADRTGPCVSVAVRKLHDAIVSVPLDLAAISPPAAVVVTPFVDRLVIDAGPVALSSIIGLRRNE